MELAGAKRTKIPRRVFLNRGAKFFRQSRTLKPRERQMRRKRPLFPRNAKLFGDPVDVRCQSFQISRSFNARPENARMFFVGEKAEPAKIERDGLIGPHAGESSSNGGELCFGHLPNEFERHVQIFRTHPARRTDAWEVRPFWRCAPAAPRRCKENGCVRGPAPIARHASGWPRDLPERPRC